MHKKSMPLILQSIRRIVLGLKFYGDTVGACYVYKLSIGIGVTHYIRRDYVLLTFMYTFSSSLVTICQENLFSAASRAFLPSSSHNCGFSINSIILSAKSSGLFGAVRSPPLLSLMTLSTSPKAVATTGRAGCKVVH